MFEKVVSQEACYKVVPVIENVFLTCFSNLLRVYSGIIFSDVFIITNIWIQHDAILPFQVSTNYMYVVRPALIFIKYQKIRRATNSSYIAFKNITMWIGW